MFEHWDSFYLLIGGGAGALIGLVFIVVSLIRGNDAGSKLRAAGVFMTPIVFHLTTVLVLSAVATASDVPSAALAVIIAAFAMGGLILAGRTVFMLTLSKTMQASHWSDTWAYGVAPGVICLGLAFEAVVVCQAPGWAARGLAIALVALLLSAIRNAWDLVTWITAQAVELDKT
jgi:hypothetical protein